MTNKFMLLAAAATIVCAGAFAMLRSYPPAERAAKYGELKRGLTGGMSAMWNGGTPACDSEFATHLVREAVDASDLVAHTPTHAHSSGVVAIANVSSAQMRTCRGTVALTDGTRIALGYTIVPQGFHRFLVNVSATPSAHAAAAVITQSPPP